MFKPLMEQAGADEVAGARWLRTYQAGFSMTVAASVLGVAAVASAAVTGAQS